MSSEFNVNLNQEKAQESFHGLKSHCLSFGEVLAQSFAVIAPTTIPASNIGLIVALSGNGTWLSMVIGLVGLVFVSININQFASRSASPGSLYSYIAKGLGPTAGVICGWSLVLAYLFTAMSVLCGFANFSAALIGHLGIHPSSITLLALGAGIAWYAGYKDIQLSAVAMLWMEGTSIVLIGVLCIFIWAHHGFALDMPQMTLSGVKPGNLATGLVLVVFAFSGFESATTLGDEAKNPLKSIPRSILGSVILAGLFLVFTTYVEVLGFRGVSDITHAEEPLAYLSQQIGLGWLGELVGLGALASFFACVLGSINPAARIFFLMARHGLFHSKLGNAHTSNKTPYIAITMCSFLTFFVPAVMSLFNIKLFESMGYLGAIASFGFITVYILISIAAPIYLHKINILRPRDIIFSLVAIGFMFIPLLGSIGIPGNSMFPVPEYPYNIFPYLFIIYIGTACGLFIFQRLRSPKMVRKMVKANDAIHIRFDSDRKP
jgi:amino acid transporter